MSSPIPGSPAAPSQGQVPAVQPDLLTEEDVKRALPAHLRSAVTQNLVDTLNGISTDPLVAENIRNNFVGYTRVLQEGKFKTEDYVHAVAYVSFKLMGYSNQDAYAKAHPDRFARLVQAGTSSKDISAYVAAYARGKLVNLILEQSMVPSWVLNQDMYQKALNVQYELMTTANSEKVRTEAANSILTHLKKPEAVKGALVLDVAESAGMKEMQNLLKQLAGQQRQMIADGDMKTVDVAAIRIIESDIEE